MNRACSTTLPPVDQTERIGRRAPSRGAQRRIVATIALLLLAATRIDAQRPTGGGAERGTALGDTLARVQVSVRLDSVPLSQVVVRSDRVTARTDGAGIAILRLAPGAHVIVTTRIGFRPDSTPLMLRTGQDTAIVVRLTAQLASLEGIVVAATRGERRVEDTPLRVEVIDEEEVAEKVAMTPGDIAMMLNETSGLRVQATNPSLGGANVRVQGLRGRYSLMLADGLPLYGGQAGSLGLLQIPPVDLRRVEIIKGATSALYGSSALGGVINLVSRTPGEQPDVTALVNQTSRGGTDGVAFFGGPMGGQWGYTLLAGAHRQERNDLDGDGWTDMPGYERAVVRPRMFFNNGGGLTAFATGGITAEDRSGGGSLGNRVAPPDRQFVEALRTRRMDVGGLARWIVPDDRALRGAILTVRGSAMEQRHAHRFGSVREDDRHRTWFSEAALAIPRERVTYIAGAAFQQETFRGENIAGFDYSYSIPALFSQLDVDPTSWLSISTSARLDAHSVYGTFLNPRVSLLLRRPATGALAEWTARLSGGTGAFAPTPFVEEIEATGLTPLAPLSGLVAERARSASLDVGGPSRTALGLLEVNATAFGSQVRHPLQVRDAGGVTTSGASRLLLVNAPRATHTWGGELLARLVHRFSERDDVREAGQEDDDDAPALRVTATYTYLRATECTPDLTAESASCARREVPLTPRHAAGVVASVEQEGKSRVGVEVYVTGRQALEDNPFRKRSAPYVIIGLLGERAFATRAGIARLFINLENLTGVRQTRFDPLLLPSRGRGGRWTTDAWTELTGFTMNGGVRLSRGG